MSNPSKKKGSQFEVSLLPALRQIWPKAERRAQHGNKDQGDFVNCEQWAIEAKNRKVMSLSAWLKEAEREAENSGVLLYAVAHKRKGTLDPMDQFITMDLRTFLRALA